MIISYPVEGRRYKHIETCSLWILNRTFLNIGNIEKGLICELKRCRLPFQPQSEADILGESIQIYEDDFKSSFIEW